MSDEEPIWEGVLDDRYRVTVSRRSDYRGVLQVVDTETDEVLHREEVGLSYGAMFGPDGADVARWQDRAIEVVENG